MANMVSRRGSMMPRTFQNMWEDDFFSGFMNNDAMPAVNVVEKENEFDLDVSVPGFKKDDISIEIDNNILRISARMENKNEEKDENDKIVRQEFSSSSFERSFVLPENINTENIKATQENGVLHIALPKQENAKEDTVKKITVS